MACLKVSTINAYLGEFTSGPLHHAVENHLACCSRCRHALDRVAQANRRVHAWLSTLAPAAGVTPVDMARARELVLSRLAGPLSFAAITSRANPRAFVSSLILQAAIVTIAFFTGTAAVTHTTTATITLIAPPLPRPRVIPQKTSARGGGQSSPLPPAKSAPLHPRAFTQFLAPITHPTLTLSPALIESPEAWSTPVAFGNSFTGLGVGGLPGPGRGPGSGPGTGPGSGDGPGIVSPGLGVSKPELILKTEPEYSEEARKAKYSGAVLLSIVVNADGTPTSIRIVKSLGMGLDEKAIEAVQKWRFKPAVSNGKPVRVRAAVEVNFRLL